METRVLEGKNALITGCARGIGKSILEAFAAEGANTWACARTLTPELVSHCAELARKHGVEVTPLAFDLTSTEQMRAAVHVVMRSSLKVNVLVNNAGITLNATSQLTTEAALRQQLEVNFIAPFLLSQYIVKLMLRNGGGSIVNVSSTASMDGNPGRSAYGASKAALTTATRALSREVGMYGIRANVIAPGITETDMLDSMTAEVVDRTVAATDLRRLGAPTDIAGAAVFLASDQSSYITGQILRIDGGM